MGSALACGLNGRRHERRQGKLAQHRIAELDALGMIWDPYEEDWQHGLEAAMLYLEICGHLRVPKDYVAADGFHLGRWIANRRIDYRRGKLAPKRAACLESLPGWEWEPGQRKKQPGSRR